MLNILENYLYPINIKYKMVSLILNRIIKICNINLNFFMWKYNEMLRLIVFKDLILR
jgi:hypothetical protein